MLLARWLARTAAAALIGLAVMLAGRPAAADYYIDTDGRLVEFEPVYQGWFGDARYTPRYARAVLENTAILAVELAIYWATPHSSFVDWQYPDPWTKLTARNAIRFDDNMHRTNWLFHPVAGTLHYSFTRVNGLGVPASFAAAATSSLLYEALFEWKELISINDLIVTPVAGMAIGEFFHQLGNYLNSRQERPRTLDEVVGGAAFGRKLAAATLGFPRGLHNALDGEDAVPPVPEDSLGLSSAYAHAFRLLLGQDVVTNDQRSESTVLVVQAEADLAAMPGFLRPGDISTWYSNGNFTSMKARASIGSRLRELYVDFDSHLFGYFDQHLVAKRGGLHGTAHEYSSRVGLHYVDRWLLDRRDHYSMVHILAPTATLRFLEGPLTIAVSGDVSPDFAALRSLAYPEWVERFGAEGTKSSLVRHGYYNAWGVSGGAEGRIGAYGLDVSLGGRYGRYESIDGLERFQSDVTREVHASDTVLELSGAIGYEPEKTLLSTRLEAAHVGRTSKMDPVEYSRWDRRLGVRVGLLF